MDTLSHIGWLSADEIQTPLSRMTGANARLSGDWIVEQFWRGQGDGLGTWRVSGEMATPAGPEAWSMVLKGWACGDRSGSPSSFNWPWREADLYSSGMLQDLPAIAAPACFHSQERDDAVWVWLEDLTGIPQEPWTLDRYGEAAFLMGRFNGAYLGGRPMPVHPSVSQQWLAGWSADGADGLKMLDEYRDHPYVQQTIPRDVEAALVHSWNQRSTVLHRLAAMPQTFSHLDAFHANTFFRNSMNGMEMVLIDWSFAGLAAVGEELAALCIAGIIFDPNTPYPLEEIEQVAFNSYVLGLRDSGWIGQEEAVWRTYRSAAILRYGVSPLAKILPILTNDLGRAAFAESLGADVDQMQNLLTRHYRWIADHACEL